MTKSTTPRNLELVPTSAMLPRSLTNVLWFDLGWIYSHLRSLRAAIDRRDIGSVWTHYGAVRSILQFHLHWEEGELHRALRTVHWPELHRISQTLRNWGGKIIHALDEFEHEVYEIEDDVTLDSLPLEPYVDQLDAILTDYAMEVEEGLYVELDRVFHRSEDADAGLQALARWREQSAHVYLHPDAVRSHPAHGGSLAAAVGW